MNKPFFSIWNNKYHLQTKDLVSWVVQKEVPVRAPSCRQLLRALRKARLQEATWPAQGRYRAGMRSWVWRWPSSRQPMLFPPTLLHRAWPPTLLPHTRDPTGSSYKHVVTCKAANHRHETPSTGRYVMTSEMFGCVCLHTHSHTHMHLRSKKTQEATGLGTNYSWAVIKHEGLSP